MKVGLLLCDHVRPGFQRIGGDYTDFFTRLLPELEIKPYDLTEGVFPAEGDDLSAFIISGSRLNVVDDRPFIGQLFDFIRHLDQERRKVVGVCFGAQAIAHALGGEVDPAPGGWSVGIKHIEVVAQERWMAPPAPRFAILHSNAQQVMSLPRGGKLLGRSDAVPISMFSVGGHLLGVQGHPEFTVDYAAILMEARRGTVIPDQVVDAGLASLNDPPSTGLLSSWISHFITGNKQNSYHT
ncbi:MAG TPA: type 1 glutamine amidotransferase [Acidimicrobiia bacterium]|nr:type 1 glutamine amidotransferase [Acidimicrobiia bacterium]